MSWDGRVQSFSRLCYLMLRRMWHEVRMNWLKSQQRYFQINEKKILWKIDIKCSVNFGRTKEEEIDLLAKDIVYISSSREINQFIGSREANFSLSALCRAELIELEKNVFLASLRSINRWNENTLTNLRLDMNVWRRPAKALTHEREWWVCLDDILNISQLAGIMCHTINE